MIPVTLRYDVEERRAELKDNWDLRGACEDWPGELHIDEVDHIIAELSGENDGNPWHWILALKDGTFAYASAWCDYTGWG